MSDNIKHPQITLNHKHEGSFDCDPVVVVLDELDRRNSWMQHVVLLPWTTPQRLLGFVHPDAKIGKEPFVLHAAFMFTGGMTVQPVKDGRVAVIPNPQLVLPYELISVVDVRIHHCPSSIHMVDQAPEFQQFIAGLMRRHLFPPILEAPATPAVPTDIRG